MTPEHLDLILEAACLLDEAHSLICRTPYRTDVLTRLLADIIDTYECRIEEARFAYYVPSAVEGYVSEVNGPNGSWCDYCTPRKLFHSTDHPAEEAS